MLIEFQKPCLMPSQERPVQSVFHAFHGFDFMRAMSEGELERTVRGLTVLSYFDRTHHYEAEHVRRTLDGVALPTDDTTPLRALLGF